MQIWKKTRFLFLMPISRYPSTNLAKSWSLLFSTNMSKLGKGFQLFPEKPRAIYLTTLQFRTITSHLYSENIDYTDIFFSPLNTVDCSRLDGQFICSMALCFSSIILDKPIKVHLILEETFFWLSRSKLGAWIFLPFCLIRLWTLNCSSISKLLMAIVT